MKIFKCKILKRLDYIQTKHLRKLNFLDHQQQNTDVLFNFSLTDFKIKTD